MSEIISQKLKLAGHFDELVFHDWIVHRASILGVDIKFYHTDINNMQIEVKGHPVLVEAFEVACSLGPASAVVDTIAII